MTKMHQIIFVGYTCRNMVGVEYILLHVLEPILYVIRKQHRHGVTETTPIADYYIIAGMVYKAPDLASVINSRMVNGDPIDDPEIWIILTRYFVCFS